MANAGRFRDTTPDMRAAGIANRSIGNELRHTMSHDRSSRPETPDRVREFQRYNAGQVGQRRPYRSDVGGDVTQRILGVPSGTPNDLSVPDTLKMQKHALQEVLDQQQAQQGRRNLPSAANPDSTFGIATVKLGSVAECFRDETPSEVRPEHLA